MTRFLSEIMTMVESDIPELLVLEQAVYDDLNAEEKVYIARKTPEQLAKFCHASNGTIFGVRDVVTGILVASAMVAFPEIADTAFNGFSVPDNEVQKAAIFLGAKVHPDYRGYGLMQKLIIARERHAIALGRTVFYTEVIADNHFSLKNLEKHGFRVVFKDMLVRNNIVTEVVFLQKIADIT